MKALILNEPGRIEDNPLKYTELPEPEPEPGELLIKVSACGVCHTDLHTVEGDITPPSYPIVPGHQVVGTVQSTGEGVSNFASGDRVGLAWLRSVCGQCTYCLSGRENLCDDIRFNGFHANGGYAEYVTAPSDFVYRIPESFSDVESAPLLCAGIIGYRSLVLSNANKGDKLALYGFGASAHVTIQVARYNGCEVYVFSRSEAHLEFAKELGAVWTGSLPETPDVLMNSSIIFAPAGDIVPEALRLTAPGGTVVTAGIYMSQIPPIDYAEHLYHEKTLRSAANSTRQDGTELLELAEKIPIKTNVQTFQLKEANEVLLMLKRGGIQGAGVLVI